MTGVLVRKDPTAAWYSCGAFRFKRGEVEWLFEHYAQLNEGCWPRKITGYIDNQFVTVPRRYQGAYFEDAAGIMAEFHTRLARCGRDGLLVLYYKGYKMPLEALQVIAKINQERLDYITGRVIGYVSGRRKARSYEEHCQHW